MNGFADAEQIALMGIAVVEWLIILAMLVIL
ncbi:hypothetical protein LCGC14_2924500, partial [marine sediment metagenome]